MYTALQDRVKELEWELENLRFRTKQALEESWGEIERLERVNASQKKEIGSLRSQLAASMPREIWAKPVLPSVASTANSTVSSLVSSPKQPLRRPSLFWRLDCSLVNNCEEEEEEENFGVQEDQEGSMHSHHTEEEVIDPPIDSSPTFSHKSQSQLISEADDNEGSFDWDNLHSQLRERNQQIDELKDELDYMRTTMQQDLDHARDTIRKLERENSYREEQMISLQSQLAGYMLQEAMGSSSRKLTMDDSISRASSVTGLSPSRHRRSLVGRRTPMLRIPLDMNYDDEDDNNNNNINNSTDDDDDDDEISLAIQKFSERMNASSRSSFTGFSFGTSSRPKPSGPSDGEKELLRQLDFLQEENRIGRQELEFEIKERDRTIKRCQETIAQQEESIEQLQQQVNDLRKTTDKGKFVFQYKS